MVHASLRKIGPVQGGAEALIQALLGHLSGHGTLVMPLSSEDETSFDPLCSPAESSIGVLAEVFRCFEGVQVKNLVGLCSNPAAVCEYRTYWQCSERVLCGP